MKGIAFIVFVILVLSGLSYLLYGRPQNQAASKATSRDTYLDLRDLAFKTSRAKLGLLPMLASTQSWGVIMDWGLTKGTATVFVFSDGNASVYLSSGGGFIGGAQHESIRKAARKMVAIAADCQPHAHLTTNYPLPEHSQVIFYLLTDVGFSLRVLRKRN